MTSATLTRTYSTGSEDILGAVTVSAPIEIVFEQEVPASSNILWTQPLTRANLKMVLLYSVPALAAGAFTLTTNDGGGTAQDTIGVYDSIPTMWSEPWDGLTRCPFVGDVTTVRITNLSSTHASTFKMKVLSE